MDSMELLKCMDKLFVPQPATRSQQCKCKSWEALLKKEGLEECLAKSSMWQSIAAGSDKDQGVYQGRYYPMHESRTCCF